MKISSAQILSFCNSNVTTFPTSRKCKNINFSLHTIPAEILYLQKYITNFLKLFFGWKRMRVAIVGENFKCTDIFFSNSNVRTFPTSPKSQNVKISILLFTLSRQKYYIPRSILRICWNFFLAERTGTWLLWLRISSAQIFWFCNSNVTTFPTSRECKNINFSLHTVAAEMLYLQEYLTNFLKLFLAERRGRWV